ncbi:hypothetical protein EDD86DRAFT_257459 [Gorgonomyces haynaldii]|nr:hypothetical protein EDD86DRAFT_257459 [Gorgonomyces haynaldii]
MQALQAALSNHDPQFSLHGAVLLKAIRTTYNIFLLSKTTHVQNVAQGTVIQMVQNVFGRIPKDPLEEKTPEPKFNPNIPDLEDEEDMTSGGIVDPKLKLPPPPSALLNQEEFANREIKDAFKVFRTICILSMKPIPPTEGTVDLRSQPMRSKLLALYLISSVLESHMYVFLVKSKIFHQLVEGLSTGETPLFVDAVKEFLILSLSRNATSPILPVFEVSMEIFGKVLIGLRVQLKKEISVFFTEIVIPVLEAKRSIPWHQRHLMLFCLLKIFGKPENDGGKLLVELYINYDCDVDAGAKENIYERISNTVSRLLSEVDHSNQTQFTPIPSFMTQTPNEVPALTTSNLVALTREQVKDLHSPNGDLQELKKMGLDFMVLGVLHPLAMWCDSVRKNDKQEEEKQQQELEQEEIADPQAIGNMKQRKQNITEGLNKNNIGEYLGEGEEENIQIMHCFVDLMDFTGLKFVEALRQFLQSFRLPGEAQKIDRFMLKFAERFLAGNPTSFSSADTAYVLAYSVIMLNTDQHNPQVKKKMTKQEFMRNNRGIDEGKDLPEEFLTAVFDEIAQNEIIMKDEPKKPQEKEQSLLGIAAPEILFARKREPTVENPNETMALKTEAVFNNLMRSKTAVKRSDQPRPKFFAAKRHEHVKQMFEIVWMPILTGISAPFQESDDPDTISSILRGFKACVHITSMFDMELELKAFLSTIINFTLISNMNHMKNKNLEAIKTLLEISAVEGNAFGELWKDVVSCISKLEKLQIQDVQEEKPQLRREGSRQLLKGTFLEEAAQQVASQSMTMLIDRIFTVSIKLNGQAIVHFVKALCEASWDEITNSANKEQPRMYCLQRLVEISYYNMNRIRVEWSNMWNILGAHFNQVGCYPNTTVGFFCIDKLRQLSIKFLELEELSNFKFQKDFLRPFEEIIRNNLDPKIKDMCLVCLQQLIQAKGQSIKSGWKTIFGSIMRSSREPHESLVQLSFDMTRDILKQHFGAVVLSGTLPDLISCLADFCKNKKAGKIPSQAIDLFTLVAQKSQQYIEATGTGVPSTPIKTDNFFPERPRSDSIGNSLRKSLASEDDSVLRFWMPILFGLHDVIMTSELDIRTKAIQQLFDTFKAQGQNFKREAWELLAKGVLFPIFEDLRLPMAKFQSKEEMAVWLSTTLIQALGQFVDLFTFYSQDLQFLLPQLLDVLSVCILHENETLSRIGSSCLHRLVEKNAGSFEDTQWEQLTTQLRSLTEQTTPSFLFFEYEGMDEKFLQQTKHIGVVPGQPLDKKEFQKQLVKCAQQAMVLQTLQDVLDPQVLGKMPPKHLFFVMDDILKSYRFANVFNDCLGLRQAVNKMGYMNQVPNLLKIETGAAQFYLQCLLLLFDEQHPSYALVQEETQKRLYPYDD